MWRGCTRRVVRALAISVLVAGCAGSLDDLTNLIGTQRKFYDAAKEAAAAGRNYDAATNALEALRVKADYADAKILLRQVAPRAYEERLTIAQQAEQAGAAQAVEQYKDLKRFTDSLAQHGVLVTPLDYDAKIRGLEGRVREVKASDADRAYDEAEGLFRAAQYGPAIDAYKRVLDLAPDHKDSKDKIAESHYQLAAGDLQAKRYRQAAEGFKKAVAERPGYKDSQVRAARIYAALGAYFLKAGQARAALADLEEATRLSPDLPRLKADLEAAQKTAIKRLAIAGVSNKTGRSIEGLAIEEYIGDELYAELQKRKSLYLELYDRSQLELLMKEIRLGLSDLVDKKTVPKLGKLKGVEFLVVGKLTQVSEKKSGPTQHRKSATYQQRTWQQGYDRSGRPSIIPVPGPTQTRQAQWDEISWSSEVAFAGSLSVLDVQTAKVASSSNFTKREVVGGRWAQDLTPHDAMSALSQNVQKLFSSPRGYESVDAVTKRVVKSMVTEQVDAILKDLDQTPNVADPPQLAGMF